MKAALIILTDLFEFDPLQIKFWHELRMMAGKGC